jgi:hypothetical protein
VYRVGNQTQTECQKTSHFHHLAHILDLEESVVLEKTLMSVM